MLYIDDRGELFEKVTFTNGITDYFYSSYLHRINFICITYKLNNEIYNDFLKAEEILKSK